MPSDAIRTRPSTKEYRDGWERTFGAVVELHDEERERRLDEGRGTAWDIAQGYEPLYVRRSALPRGERP